MREPNTCVQYALELPWKRYQYNYQIRGTIYVGHHAEINQHLFSGPAIEKSAFEKSMLIGVGRDLKLPQLVAQQQSRLYASRTLLMWQDGFTIEYSLECLIDWVIEGAKVDDDLFWHLHKRCRNTEELFEFE